MNWAESIKRKGWAVIPRVFRQRESAGLLQELKRANLPRSRAGVRHAMRIPAVAEMAREAELLGIAREILGEGAFPFRATLFDTSPTANWPVVWHQDTSLPLKERREIAGWGPVVGEGWRAVCACSGECARTSSGAKSSLDGRFDERERAFTCFARHAYVGSADGRRDSRPVAKGC